MTPRRQSRRGTFVPMLAVCLTALLAFVALAVDLGMITLARAQCQNAADSCALAAARELNARPASTDAGYGAALAASNAIAPRNRFIGQAFTAPGAAATVGAPGLRVGFYDYNATDGQFSTNLTAAGGIPPGGRAWTAAQVVLRVQQQLFFARVFPTIKGGTGAANPFDKWANGATATAVHRPRDIAMILDFSGSMRFGSTFNWGEAGGSPDASGGMLSSDAQLPRFGHYQRFEAYQTTNPNASLTGAIAARPHPLRATVGYTDPGSGELLAPNNYTAANASGPACVNDFYTDPDAPANGLPSVTYDPTYNTLAGAERAFDAATSSVGVVTPLPDAFGTQTYTTLPYTGGDLWPRKWGAMVANATAASWSPTANTGSAVTAAEFLGWVNRYTGGGGTTVRDLPLDTTNNVFPASLGAGNARRSTTAGQGWTLFRDAAWERYGYDLDVANYVARRRAGVGGLYPQGWDPRWDYELTDRNNPAAGGTWRHAGQAGDTSAEFVAAKAVMLATQAITPTIQLKPANQRFQGFTMGPGHWGKTFFIWPPDPRAPVGNPGDANYVPGDWRRRFFLAANGNALRVAGTSTSATDQDTTPTAATAPADNDTVTANTQTINTKLLTNGVGHTLGVAPYYTNQSAGGTSYYRSTTPAPTNFQVNYPAVLRWIRAGPQVFPPNLRSGRCVYYTSIPDDVNFTASGSTQNPTTAAGRLDLDRFFWKTYIDYVLEQYSRGMKDLAGFEQVGWPETAAAATPSIDNPNVALANYAHPGAGGNDPMPYMDYRDNPSRPRLHLWFGPLSMMAFIAAGTKSNDGNATALPMWPGTTHEAQAWQLKAAINSGLDDIRFNHPNDFVGMTYFSSGTWNGGPVVNSGQNWNNLKDVLFYPRTMAATGNPSTVRSNVNAEYWPYWRNGRVFAYQGNGNLPNANGGTCPSSGFAQAYNTLTTWGGGRRGAAKIVIFETDGVPNATCGYSGNYVSAGYNSRYSGVGSFTSVGNPAANSVVTPLSDPGSTSPAGHPSQMTQVYDLIRNRFVPNMATSTSGTSGTSLPSSPTRVYSIAFGDLFANPTAFQRTNALAFLTTVQKYGGTSAWNATSLPANQIITGDFQTRIDNLRATLERILQSGVQVTLIE